MASVTILSDNGATSGSAGLKTSGGNDGVLLLQTTTSGGTPTTAITIDNTQTVTFTNQPTYTGGTANGVLYLNGSKAVTSGTALVFDGTNLGVGATPSAWSSGTKALQVIRGSLWHDNGNYVSVNNNAYYDGTNWRYINSAYATNYNQVNGAHVWNTTGSGTAGNTISWTQAMTLTASNQLLIGTSSSSQALELVNTFDGVTRGRITNTSTGTSAIAEWSSWNGSLQTVLAQAGPNRTTTGTLSANSGYVYTDSTSLSLIAGGSSGVIKFGSGGSYGEIGRITSAGNYVLAGGTTSANGVGITFPASQSASSDANCLDDYEEGSWTPSISAGGLTVSSVNRATYTKVGNRVTVAADIYLSGTGNASTLTISGLPFSVVSAGWAAGNCYFATMYTQYWIICALPASGTSTIIFQVVTTGGAGQTAPGSAIGIGYANVCCTYEVA